MERARKCVPHTMRVEIECETLAQVEEALAAGADSILLDNMTLDDMRRARTLAPAIRRFARDAKAYSSMRERVGARIEVLASDHKPQPVPAEKLGAR